jgi:hypothetical protein
MRSNWRIWDAETGQMVGEPLTVSELSSAAFSSDGKWIATASFRDGLQVWDTRGPTIAQRLYSGSVSSAAFSPNGLRVVTPMPVARPLDDASLRGPARVWNTYTQAEENRNPFPAIIASIVEEPDPGPRYKPLSRVYPSREKLLAFAKARAPRGLTVAQRKSFFLDPEPPAWYIEMEKWPYHTPAWKQWLADKKAGKQVPLPDR